MYGLFLNVYEGLILESLFASARSWHQLHRQLWWLQMKRLHGRRVILLVGFLLEILQLLHLEVRIMQEDPPKLVAVMKVACSRSPVRGTAWAKARQSLRRYALRIRCADMPSCWEGATRKHFGHGCALTSRAASSLGCC